MRKTALLGLTVAAASLLPVAPASAFCVEAYEQLTGQCSPCPAVQRNYDNVRDRTGNVLPAHTFDCFE